jgi:hypothetical protein
MCALHYAAWMREEKRRGKWKPRVADPVLPTRARWTYEPEGELELIAEQERRNVNE